MLSYLNNRQSPEKNLFDKDHHNYYKHISRLKIIAHQSLANEITKILPAGYKSSKSELKEHMKNFLDNMYKKESTKNKKTKSLKQILTKGFIKTIEAIMGENDYYPTHTPSKNKKR